MAVLGFRGMPKNPIIAPVIINGMMLGISEMTIILRFANSIAIMMDMITNASTKLNCKFSTRNLLPLIKSGVVPVIEAVMSVPLKISSI